MNFTRKILKEQMHYVFNMVILYMDKFVERQINTLENLVQKDTTANTTQATKKRVKQIIQLYTQ